MTPSRAAILALLLAPLVWLWPSAFGGRVFVPYDITAFPPASLALSPTELGTVQQGANTDVTEVPVWFVPETELARRELAAGRLPTWNPHARGGSPLHAHGLLGLCYPPNWLLLAANDPADALVFVAWLNLALAGLLAFALLRALGIGVLAAWFGALLFQLSGPVAANAFFWMRLGSFVWLPGVLWGVLAVATADRLRARHLAGLAVPLAMTWLAGFPPFAATTSLLGAAFAAWLLVARHRAAPQHTRRLALRLLAAFALGGMLALPQVLPSLQFFPHSARPPHPEWRDIEGQAFQPYGLLGYALPDAFGHPIAQAIMPYGDRNPLALLLNPGHDAVGTGRPNFNYTEYAVFVGQLGLLLGLCGALLGRGTHRRFAITAWLGCAALALFVPGARALFLLPLVENVWPMRWLAPATLFVAWLAALGLERVLASARALPSALAAIAATAALAVLLWAPAPLRAHLADRDVVLQRLVQKYGYDTDTIRNHVQGQPPVEFDRFEHAFARLAREGKRAAAWFAGVAAWALLLGLCRDERRRRQLGLLAGAAAFAQLGVHGGSITRGSLHARSPDTPVHTFLRERADAAAASGGFTIARGDLGFAQPEQLPPGQLLVPGIRDLHFYSHFDGRSLQPVQRLLGSHLGTVYAGKGYLTAALPPRLPPPGPLAAEFANGNLPRDFTSERPWTSPLFDLLGVRYVLSCGPAPLPDTGEVVAIPGAPTGFHVQERRSALPRAFAVDTVNAHASDVEVVQALLAPDFAPRRAAHALAADLPSPMPTAPSAPTPREVTFVLDTPTHLELAVAAGASPWLLLTDTFLPGWTATIDGVDTPIVRGDHAFRLVQLPERACRVAFRYRAPGLFAGFALAAFAALALAVSAFATRRALPAA